MRTMNTVDVAQLVRRRKALGLTQHALALQIGVAPSTVMRWERGSQKITPLAQAALEATLIRLEHQRNGGTAAGPKPSVPHAPA